MAKKPCTFYVSAIHAGDKWQKDREKILGEDWQVLSAGIEAHGSNPNAVKAMKKVGIDISN